MTGEPGSFSAAAILHKSTSTYFAEDFGERLFEAGRVISIMLPSYGKIGKKKAGGVLLKAPK